MIVGFGGVDLGGVESKDSSCFYYIIFFYYAHLSN